MATRSQLLAINDLAEMRANAAAAGDELDAETVELFEHLATCTRCVYRLNNDPEFCEIAEGIQEG